MKDKLGNLKKLKVRTCWPDEAKNFTPWLVREENIALLGKALGLELEVENTEVQVGPYSADILARVIGTGAYVVIENQLGKTDHDHLGKLVTYASVLNATSLVWIAGEFTEEHRRSFEWLNDISAEEFGFYAVQLELWQIDDSLPAVKFDVISQPAEMMKQIAASKASANVTPTQQLQLEFWTELRNRLVRDKVLPSYQTPRAQYWYSIALGRSGIYLATIADTYGKKIGVIVTLMSKIAESALQQLSSEKMEIESEIGQPLQWNPNPNNKEKVIALYRDQADISIKENWPDYCDWLVDKVKLFRKAFIPRIKDLDLAPPSQD